ncbi:hypothetical protein PV08_08513 [Exophiala spinifera]|uniref:D-xylose 1-dehydrogenase (NADP(+), D-xylono-1,5-lactone-forming) n=1 Tax=Exophiala spinifera TaxID=91928 RepID=A0A0D2B3R5_9EURO|nr:uncharacterized protein PV08_08513 [Exophiala spinifera]KIW13325.1 hypothetical protein PV08_08513 [Exophiala spinifera]
METRTIRWGILATGLIAKTFAKDLLVDPRTRNVHDVRHTVVAAASSSGLERAQQYLRDIHAPQSAKGYGSYEELVGDEAIDCVYVSTPHSHHYQNVMLCLEAGKNVLCEKAFTVNAAQARKLVETARQKNVLLMEAMWTRYFPLSIYVRECVTSGKLGPVIRVFAENAEGDDPEKDLPDSHRLVNPALAGGVLLDMAVYSLTWVFQTLYTTQAPEVRKAPYVQSSVQKYPRTGVDELTTILLTFPRDANSGGNMHGVASASLRLCNDYDHKGSSGPAVRVQGTKGEVQVWPPIYRPTRTRVVLATGEVEDKTWPQPGPGKGSNWYNGFEGMNPEGEGHGMFWEADEVARALVAGRKEPRAEFQSLNESVLIMEVMDEVRKHGDLIFPAEIETTDRVALGR